MAARVATDGGEILETDCGIGAGDDRPDDCECDELNGHGDDPLPCWPCYRDGADEPAGVE